MKFAQDYTYLRFALVGFFLGCMAYFLSSWVIEYYQVSQSKSFLSGEIKTLRQNIIEDAYEFQRVVKQFDTQHRINKSNDSVSESEVHPKIEDTNLPSKIQLLGVLELELAETTSWHTLLKMMVTVLVTFFGIKLINRFFNNWQ